MAGQKHASAGRFVERDSRHRSGRVEAPFSKFRLDLKRSSYKLANSGGHRSNKACVRKSGRSEICLVENLEALLRASYYRGFDILPATYPPEVFW